MGHKHHGSLCVPFEMRERRRVEASLVLRGSIVNVHHYRVALVMAKILHSPGMPATLHIAAESTLVSQREADTGGR